MGDGNGWAGEGELAGGELEENLAEILENHELRRWVGVPFGLGFSMEPDREGRLCEFEPLGGVDWPFVEWSIEADAGALADAPGICRGRAGAGAFVGGEFFSVFSRKESVEGSREAVGCASRDAAGGWRVAKDMPLGAPWVIQLTSTPWTCSMLGSGGMETTATGMAAMRNR